MRVDLQILSVCFQLVQKRSRHPVRAVLEQPLKYSTGVRMRSEGVDVSDKGFHNEAETVGRYGLYDLLNDVVGV